MYDDLQKGIQLCGKHKFCHLSNIRFQKTQALGLVAKDIHGPRTLNRLKRDDRWVQVRKLAEEN